MGLLQKNICPNCGEEYSALRGSCPKCGARKAASSRRTPPVSDSVRQGTAAGSRNRQNAKWQLIFGLCLVAAVIIAVIVLITTTLSGNYGSAAVSPSPDVVEVSTPPSEAPTPPPTPTVEELTITFLGQPLTDNSFAMKVGDTIQLKANIFPVEIEGIIEWSSTDETICTVSDTGLVTGIGSGTGTVIARCYGAAVQCTVLVW